MTQQSAGDVATLEVHAGLVSTQQVHATLKLHYKWKVFDKVAAVQC